MGHYCFNISTDDLRQYDWQQLIDEHPEKEYRDFMAVFDKAAAEQGAAGDDRGKRVYSFLSAVASCYANYDQKGNPYGPMWQTVKGRTFTPEDLTASELDILSEILNDIADPEYRARIGDILWIRRRDYKAAQTAIRAFIESAHRLETDDLWPTFVTRLQRALQLAATLGFGKELHQEVVAEVEATIARYESNPKSGVLCARLMRLLLDQNQGDPAKYSALSESQARHFSKVKEWHFAEEYWEVAERWHRRATNITEAQRCQLAGAEILIARAEDNLAGDKPSYGFAAHWMSSGVEALRRAKADPARVAEIHQKTLELQKLALTELKTVQLNIDANPQLKEAEEKCIESARAHVRGYPWVDAFRRFAFIAKPTNVDELRQKVEENSKKFISGQLFGTVALDAAGKVADIAPSSSGDDYEGAIRKQMYQNAARVYWPMTAMWQIEPGRYIITSEHPVSLNDLEFLVLNNPFVPEGREGIYARGIQAGFYGDWLIATHLLIPQLEASIRQVLQQNGVITSTLDSDGIQQERDLGFLVCHPMMAEIFGAGIAFDLRGILVEKFGHNLRNDFAHGLLPEGGFYQPASICLWWLAIRLCWLGHLMVKKDLEETEE
ncbi:DUF4209 domain-containing protein [Trichlorobacter lovleyi]|uniref:DUF4209 domain-containing protein n=1 Tax=Trichlorobacter lovleyi TaxID=313985 RepID=UPI003C6EA8D3